MSEDIKKASTQRNEIVPQAGGRFLKQVPETIVGTESWILATWDQGTTQKDPEVNPKDKLWAACQAWIDKYQVDVTESIYQTDRVQEALSDLAETVCGVVGYHKESGDG